MDDSCILVYDYYDEGFYVASGKIPDIKYFTRYNIKIDDAEKVQEDYVRDKKADFVISVNEKPDEVSLNYNCIKEEEYTNYHTKSIYYLWERK